MKLEDLLWLALGAAALGIGVGIMNNLAALTAEIHTELDALHQLLDSRLLASNLLPDLDPVIRLATAELSEKSKANKCPECGARPVFKTFLEAASAEKKGALALMMLSGGFTEGSGYWHYTYHLENWQRRETR